MNALRVVGGVFERADGTVLACRRSPGRSAGGRWEFPGGKVEPGEDPREALARELREELSVDVAVGALINRTVRAVGRLNIDLACYRVQVLSAEPDSSTDHDELTWLPADQLRQLDWADPDWPAVCAVAGEAVSLPATE